MPSQNPFRKSNRSRMGSSAYTDSNQGGGSKKAGFPYQIGRIYGVSNILNSTDPVSGRCCTLTKMNTLRFPLARQSRPIGSRYGANYHYWNIPGTGK
jgi:hypothetical protein